MKIIMVMIMHKYMKISVLGFFLGLFLVPAIPWAQAKESTVTSGTLAPAQREAMAQYLLAKRYTKGEGVPQDYGQAAKFMKQAAERGCAYAQNDLGTLYAKGLGVPQDFQTAAQWYRRAAEQGDYLGQYSLGLSYLQGRGLARDPVEALVWLKRAARQNQTDAMLVLANLYFTGFPEIPQNLPTACHWFKEAARHGRSSALNSLGFIYENGGAGVPKNLDRAFKFYRQAAEQGDDQGQMNLGRAYRDGVGVKRDLSAAYTWLYLAVQNGNGIARHYLMGLEGADPLIGKALLTPDQIQEAIRKAGKYKK